MRLPQLMAFALLLAGCTEATGPSDQRTLFAENLARWSRQGPASYEYTITRACECTPESSGPVTVVVINGRIETRRYASGAAVDPQFEDLFTAVPGLFDLIRSALDLPAAALAVRYDGSLGYPESIQIDWVAGAADDEVSYTITGFSARPST